MALGDYTDRTEIKEYIEQLAATTVHDTLLDKIATRVSREIDAYCGRRFYVPASDETLTLDGQGNPNLFGLDLASVAAVPATPVLAPGFGHQGARFADLGRLYGPAAPVTIVAASRSILEAGPDGIFEAIRMQAAEVFACRA